MDSISKHAGSSLRAEYLLCYAKEHGINSVHFPIYINSSTEETDIDVLDLTQRGINCLKRSAIRTVADLANILATPNSLSRIRGLGAKTESDIIHKLYLYQYSILNPEQQTRFITKVIEMNNIK